MGTQIKQAYLMLYLVLVVYYTGFLNQLKRKKTNFRYLNNFDIFIMDFLLFLCPLSKLVSYVHRVKLRMARLVTTLDKLK